REAEDLTRRVDHVERLGWLVASDHGQDAGGDDPEHDADAHEHAVAGHPPNGRLDGLVGIGGGHASIVPLFTVERTSGARAPYICPTASRFSAWNASSRRP